MAHKYFMLSIKGDSVDQPDINAGELLLVRQQTTAKHGDKVVMLINNKISVKEYSSIKRIGKFKIQGVVVTTMKKD